MDDDLRVFKVFSLVVVEAQGQGQLGGRAGLRGRLETQLGEASSQLGVRQRLEVGHHAQVAGFMTVRLVQAQELGASLHDFEQGLNGLDLTGHGGRVQSERQGVQTFRFQGVQLAGSAFQDLADLGQVAHHQAVGLSVGEAQGVADDVPAQAGLTHLQGRQAFLGVGEARRVGRDAKE
jgi:hypothetical protein